MVPFHRRVITRGVAIAAVWAGLCVVAAYAARNGMQDASGIDPCHIQTSARIVAIGDIHGAYDKFVSILREAKLIDRGNHWSGGRAVFVQVGDVLDRGADSRKALDLLRRLEGEAAGAGGQVHALLGNHEVMRMLGDLRYTSKGEYAAFRTTESRDLRDRYATALASRLAEQARAAGQPDNEEALRQKVLDETPLGWVEMQRAFGPSGEYGSWLRGHDVMVKVNGVAFLHGGTTLETARLGCAAINATAREELTASTPPDSKTSLTASADGPLWYRGLAKDDSGVTSDEVTGMLRALEARAIVIGHTPTTERAIRARFDGRVFLIDTGMLDGSFFPGGKPSALEIEGDTFTAISGGKRRIVVTVPGGPGPKTRDSIQERGPIQNGQNRLLIHPPSTAIDWPVI